ISSFMVMYENESVDVRYGNGAQLQLSPCGCEFMLMKPTDPSEHPLQTRGRVRQRTRFATSTYKEMIMTALAFRNKYASRPYLPEELIPAGHKKPFFSIDSDVNWPECSLCDAEFGPGGETIIRSEDGRIVLTLSPSGEEFSVEFTCSLSHYQTQHHSMEAFSRDSEGGPGGQQQVSNLICQTAGDKTKEVHQGMVQHHSCRSVAPIWCYPLSLARHLQMAHFSKPEDVRGEGARDITPAHRETNVSDVARHSHLPQALPLTCLSPHWHRWNFTDLRAKKEHDLPTELVKVMWCQGVTYRILSGGLIEVSPGDGSVIRSNGVLNTYFTHHKPEILSGQLNVSISPYNCLLCLKEHKKQLI
uniref:Uncharacterized protein n=1 Tax=Mola mola TaxID=94237 RepID=A0A3Q3WY46_MOLML